VPPQGMAPSKESVARWGQPLRLRDLPRSPSTRSFPVRRSWPLSFSAIFFPSFSPSVFPIHFPLPLPSSCLLSPLSPPRSFGRVPPLRTPALNRFGGCLFALSLCVCALPYRRGTSAHRRRLQRAGPQQICWLVCG
jgi:hypothetical protein